MKCINGKKKAVAAGMAMALLAAGIRFLPAHAAKTYGVSESKHSGVDKSSAQSESSEKAPKPWKVINFNGGLNDLVWGETGFEIVKSRYSYVQKKPYQVEEGEKVDANGLVYTGDDERAAYYKGLISNQPTTKYDDEKGTYLQMGVKRRVPAIYKTKPAGVSNELEAAALDAMVPCGVSGGTVTPMQEEYIVSSELCFDNPLADEEFAEQVEEKDGITISYWLKVPLDEEGREKASCILHWETSEYSNSGKVPVGEFQIDANGSMYWTPDGNESVSAAAVVTNACVLPTDSIKSDEKALPGGNSSAWHQVTVCIGAASVEVYVDGVPEHSSQNCIQYTGWDKQEEGKKLSEWLTEDSTLHIGGCGVFGTACGMSSSSEDFALDDLCFYSGVLSEEEIAGSYQKDRNKMEASGDVTAKEVDLTDITDISNVEHAISESVEEISGHAVYAVGVATNGRAKYTAGAKMHNPFAGKDIEGATIGYWIKQEDAENTSVLLFMDEKKKIYHPKGSVESAASVLYAENAGEAIFAEGYSNSGVCNSVQNLYYTALDSKEKERQLAKTTEWMYITLTMNNAGITYYVNGEPIIDKRSDVPCSRFLDGYYQILSNADNPTMLNGLFGRTNNQGATPLMKFLTAEDTALYLGYYPTKGMMNNNITSGCMFAGIRTVDAALGEEEVKEFYNQRFQGLTIPERKPSEEPVVSEPVSGGSVSEAPKPSESSAAEKPENSLRGDVDGDNQVTLKDAQQVLRAALNLLRLDKKQEKIADVDGNQKVELKDAQMILKAALNLMRL